MIENQTVTVTERCYSLNFSASQPLLLDEKSVQLQVTMAKAESSLAKQFRIGKMGLAASLHQHKVLGIATAVCRCRLS